MLSRLLHCVFALTLLCLTSSSDAQSYIYDAGAPTYGVNIPVENGFINVTNGNLHMEFPLAQHPQRGELKLNERLVYDSHFWKIGQYSNYYWWPDNVPRTDQLAAGWRFENGAHAGVISSVPRNFRTTGCPGYPNTGGYTSQSYDLTFVWTDPTGTNHPFSAIYNINHVGDKCSEDPPVSNPESTSGTATDSSGYTITISGDDHSGPSTYFIRDNNGTQVYPTIADRYGNFWSTDASGNLVDDRGQAPVTVTYNGNQIYYDVLRQGGGRARYTVTTAQVTPHTQFGQQAVAEYPNGNNAVTLNAVQSIQLPDGSSYQFQYENTFGMITGVTLPTGGHISYGWSNYTDSYGNVNRWLTSRTAGSDPASTFTPAVVTTCGSNQQNCHETVTVHEPGGDETLYDMQLNNGAWNTNTRRYSGSATGGTLVSSTDTDYQFSAPCGIYCVGSQFITKQTTTTTLADTGLKRTDSYEYANNQLGLVSAKKVYDFYMGSLPSQPLQQTQYIYANTTVPADLAEVKQVDGSGNLISRKTFSYTQSAQSTPLVGHDASLSMGVYAQSSADWVDTNGSFLATQVTMDDAGTVLSSTDPNGTTTYSHDGTDTFVTGTSLPTPSSGVALASGSSPDATTGVPLSSTDLNNQTTTYQNYDSLNRVGEIDSPNGGTTTYSRTPTSVFVTTSMNASQSAVKGTQFDEFGRTSRTATANGQSGTPWYQTDTCYNANGQVEYTSLPYAGTGLNQTKTCSGVHYTYDTLGRPSTISDSDGDTQYSYRGRATKVTDVNGKQKITQVDALGRITAVCEVSSQSVSGTAPQDCGLDISGSGYLTTYTYDLVNHKTTVLQGDQTRVFRTDSLGRTIYTFEPERGNTYYSYIYSGTGLGILRNRPRANQAGNAVTQTFTQYDLLGRVISISYDDAITPTRYFKYDQASAWGGTVTLGASKGHLTEHTTAVAGNFAGASLGYDVVGNVNWTDECLPSGCGITAYDKFMTYNYDYLGNVTNFTDSANITTTYQYSPASEISGMQTTLSGGTYPSNLVSNVQNTQFGPRSFYFGNGLSQYNAYDSLGRTRGGWVCAQAPVFACSNQRYGWYATYKGAQMQSSSDGYTGQGTTYTYDDFNRVISANFGNGSHTYSFTYDRWGNRTSQSAPQGGYNINSAFDASTNHSTSFVYDAAGNLSNDGVHSYTYDAEGNVIAVDGGATARYFYNALNQRVRSELSGNVREFVYNLAGQRLSTWDGITHAQLDTHYYWGNFPVAWADSSSMHFQHTDGQGTSRLETAYDGSIEHLHTSGLWGEGFAGGVSDAPYYTGQEHDSETDTDHATFRQYSPVQGRWMSPDPYDGSYDFSNPQSLNRYAYVNNMPLSATDPSGLQCHGDPTGCGSGGGDGSWIEGIIDVIGQAISSLFGHSSFHGSLHGRPVDREATLQADGTYRLSVSTQGLSLGGGANLGSMSSLIGLVAFAPNRGSFPTGCSQLPSNARNLDYSQKLYKKGTQTTQDHIVERHMSGLSGVSQYNAKSFQQIRNLNAITFFLGYQSFDRGSYVFDFTIPDFATYFNMRSFVGIDDAGNPTLTNHLVVQPDCKTVVTSYGIPD